MPSTPDEIIKEVYSKKFPGKEVDLWDVQQIAIDEKLLDEDKNFVIIAPTASGKTLTAEFACYKCLKEGGRIVYLVPTNSLITDKESEFKYLEDEYKVVGSDASASDWRDSNIIITSNETFYKTALLTTSLAEGYNLAIIDEFHLLYDKLRGFTLEKIMTLLKMLGMRILCLSATFESKDEVGGWLEAQIIDIPEESRIIPLVHETLEFTGIEGTFRELSEKELGPYIIFCSTRDYCRSRATAFSELIPSFQKPVTEIFEELRGAVERQNLKSLEQELGRCLAKGVGFHHSGLDTRIKYYVEEQFLAKQIKYLFCTTGLAYGINLPARSVVIWDLKIYDRIDGVQRYIPVHMYQQMAGRAGRPQFGDDGYSFIITRNQTDETAAHKYYIPGILDKAVSHIAEDAYFRKAILELVYSGRRRQEEILDFFRNTFYNYQSEHTESLFSDFDLMSIIKSHVVYLEKTNFMIFMGAPGYQLSQLGKATLDFLFNTFSTYDLDVFISLEKYVDEIDELEDDFNIIYTITKLFGGARLSKIPRKKNEEIETYYERLGIEDVSHSEYSAYVIWRAWIENLPVEIIEDRYHVYTGNIERVARELYNLLSFTENLAKIKGKPVTEEYETLKHRVRRGYSLEESPFIGMRYFGRILIRLVSEYCKNVLTNPPWNCRGTVMEILLQLKAQKTKEEFIQILSGSEMISQVRATRIFDFLESYIKRKK